MDGSGHSVRVFDIHVDLPLIYLEGAGDIGGVFVGFITSVIWEETLDWLYSQLMGLISDFFQQMNNMGAQIFELSWVKAIILFFTQFGWAMFLIGLVVAVFDTAVGAQTGRADIKGTALNAMKGFFAVSLFSVLPVRLYQFSITLQGSLSHGLARLLSVNAFTPAGLAQAAIDQIKGSGTGSPGLFNTLLIIALIYCVVKVFFQNLKRGGILLIQIAVGSLYLFSVPRGYTDGWIQWCKRVIGLCLTAFLQTTILTAGLITFRSNYLLGVGLMLSAKEVERIAEAFGMDTSTKANLSGVMYAASSVVNVTKQIAAVVK